MTTGMQSIETTARVYIIMEEALGGDLLNTVRKHRRISEPRAGIWFKQMCDAVEYCHQRGVVHRDLKCENILLDSRVSPVAACTAAPDPVQVRPWVVGRMGQTGHQFWTIFPLVPHYFPLLLL